MKRSFVVFILMLSIFLCCCSPLRKNIVNEYNNKATGEAVGDNNNNKIFKDTDEGLKVEYSAKDSPGMTNQDNLNESIGEKTKIVPETEKLNTSQAPETIRPQPVKPVPLKASYNVKVDISDQKVYIYKNDTEMRVMTCSTGVKGHETPEGTFKINGRGDWFFSEEFQQGGKYWVGFIGGTYLFHSVPADRKQRIIEEEASKLGTPASHGCVRLSEEDAKWFKDTIPDGSKVIIQK